MLKLLLVFGLGMVMAGCAQTPQSITPMSAQKASYIQSEKSYKIGQPQRAYIGARILRVQQYAVSTSDVAVPNESFTMMPWSSLGGFSADQGVEYRITATMVHNGETFYVIPLRTVGVMMSRGAALVRRDGSIFDHPYVTGNVIAPDTFTVSPAGARFILTESKNAVPGSGDANFELVYSGIANNSIRVLYREFTSTDMARPAFSQELTYDQSSKQIRFRNLLLTVESATNEEIAFTVIADTPAVQ